MTADPKIRTLRRRLRMLLGGASPLPWIEDDGNIFSEPATETRQALAMAKSTGDADAAAELAKLDSGRQPFGFVATTTQESDLFDENATLIAEGISALPRLLDALDKLDPGGA